MFNFIKKLLGIEKKSKVKDCCSPTTSIPEAKAPEVKVVISQETKSNLDSLHGKESVDKSIDKLVDTIKNESTKLDKPKSKKRRYYKKPNKKKGE